MLVSKTSVGASPSGVRIPPYPPFINLEDLKNSNIYSLGIPTPLYLKHQESHGNCLSLHLNS